MFITKMILEPESVSEMYFKSGFVQSLAWDYFVTSGHYDSSRTYFRNIICRMNLDILCFLVLEKVIPSQECILHTLTAFLRYLVLIW